MRKDVKLAFVVGGILISVLVVYVLVVPGGQKRPDQQAVTLDTTDTKPPRRTPSRALRRSLTICGRQARRCNASRCKTSRHD